MTPALFRRNLMGASEGFTYRCTKNGEVEILHLGKLASTLRGNDVKDFVAEVEFGEYSDGQEVMARITGNYKHGNERTADTYPRNRR